MLPVIRSEEERRDPHPLLAEFMERRVGKTFARDEVREEVIPVYMGLIKQIDDQLGLLFRFMEDRGLFDKTLIVFTSDHGDYLGDHWMGEKDLFHEPSVKVPLIVYDPSDAADAARGTTCDELVESIDLIPTFLREPRRRSRRAVAPAGRPLAACRSSTARAPTAWRRFAISEYDYSLHPFSAKLGIEPRDAQPLHGGRQALEADPRPGLPADALRPRHRPQRVPRPRRRPPFEAERQRLMAALNAWGLRLSQRTTLSEQQMRDRRGKSQRRGILIGVWDESDVPDELWSRYLGDTT